MCLSLLKAEVIDDIFWSSPEDKGVCSPAQATEIGAKLKIKTEEEEAQYVAKWVLKITTGVPRLV